MANEKALKLLGVAATVVGLGSTLFSGIIADKKNDALIEKKIAEALNKQDNK